jgi:hypothetical protein
MSFDPLPFNYVGWVGAHVIESDGDHSIAEYIHRVTDANVTGDWISAWGFGPDDLFASLVVNRGEGSDPICGGDFDLSEGDPWLECWQQGVDILPEDEVLLFVDGVGIKDHTVIDLTLDAVILEEGHFAGTAPEYSTVRVDVCNSEEDCYSGEYPLGENEETWQISFGQNLLSPDAWYGVYISDADGDSTYADYVPPPVLDVNITWDWISAWGFGPDDLFARLVVNRGEGSDPICEGDFNLSEEDPWLECSEQEVDILPGDEVLLFVDGEPVKDHTVFDLTLDIVDIEGGYFEGTAPEWSTVRVDVCNPPFEECSSLEYNTEDSTIWVISFGSGAVDPEAWFGAFMVDEDGDQTMAELFIPEPPPFPVFTVQPDHGWVGSWGWPVDVPITLTIDEDTNHENGFIFQKTQNSYLSWEPGIGEVWFELGSIADQIYPGLYVSMTDSVITKDTWIADLSFDSIDPDTLMAAGTGPDGGAGHVYLETDMDWFNREIIVETTDTWSADFSGETLDLDSLVEAHVVIWDDDGDETMANLFIPEPPPLPWFTVHPDHGWVGSGGWPIGVEIDLTITDPVEGIIFQDSMISEQDEWDPEVGAVWFDLNFMAEQLQPDVFVSLSDGVATKDTVIVPLSFDLIDSEGNAIGTGPSGGFGHVCLDHESGCQPIEVPTDGEWSTSFSWYDPEFTDLSEAHVVIWDEDGDETMANLDIYIPPQPFFNVNLTAEMIHALGWPFGEIITLQVDDPSTTESPDYSVVGTVAGYTSYDPELTLFDFDVSSYGILPGFLVRISDNIQVKEHIVTGLVIDEVNYDNSTVAGSTSPDSPVDVLAFGSIPEFYSLTSETDGTWTVNFSQDLLDFFIIIFSQGDDDGDATQWIIFPNHPPTAEDDSYSINEDSVLTEPVPGVLFNDNDPEDGSLTTGLVTDVQHGMLVLNPDGSFSYTPDPDYFGPDSFSYLASDGERLSNEAVVTIVINSVNDDPIMEILPEFTLNEGETFSASGSFSDPDPDVWTATVDYFSDGVEVQNLPLSPEKTFTLGYAYPFDDGVYNVTVSIDDGQVQGSEILIVTVNNVPPLVDITSDADGEAFILTGFDVNLIIYFTDPGTDTHSVLIDWGDGSQEIDPALSPVTESHPYQLAGEYSIVVTVTDDDGGVGFASTNVRIVEPSEAAQYVIDELATILTDPELDPAVTAAVENALVDLEGANDGLGNGGALDKIDGGQWNAALVKIERAIQDLEEAENADPTLDLSEIKEVLALTAKSVALEVISQAGELANVEGAYALISEGQILLDGGNYLGAVSKFQDAIHVL